jgi:hypothetical protein
METDAAIGNAGGDRRRCSGAVGGAPGVVDPALVFGLKALH